MGNLDNNKIWKLIWISGAIFVVELGLLVFAIIKHEPPKVTKYVAKETKNHVVVTNTVIAKKLESIGELASYEYKYEGNVTKEADKEWVILNQLTKSTITIDYEGTIKAGIRVEDIQINVSEDEGLIYLTLPKPYVISNEINATNYSEDVKVFGNVKGSDGSDMLDTVKKEQQEAAINNGLLTLAEKNSEDAIKKLLSVYDYYHIIFVDAEEGGTTK